MSESEKVLGLLCCGVTLGLLIYQWLRDGLLMRGRR